jgi:beta-glucosidase
MYSKEKPLYAFGYGLSYTTFDYKGLSPSSSQMGPDGSMQVHVKVKNTGRRASDEVVEMYVQHMNSAVTRPQLELKGFKRVRIEAGAEKDVTLELKARDLAYWDTPGHLWRVEKEKVRILAGGSSDKLPVQTVVDVTGTKDYKP